MFNCCRLAGRRLGFLSNAPPAEAPGRRGKVFSQARGQRWGVQGEALGLSLTCAAQRGFSESLLPKTQWASGSVGLRAEWGLCATEESGAERSGLVLPVNGRSPIQVQASGSQTCTPPAPARCILCLWQTWGWVLALISFRCVCLSEGLALSGLLTPGFQLRELMSFKSPFERDLL